MKFTKMHGCGNDYVYVNCFEEKVNDPASLSIRISDRHKGIGADGLILILLTPNADAFMQLYNSDGSSERNSVEVHRDNFTLMGGGLFFYIGDFLRLFGSTSRLSSRHNTLKP